MPLLEAPADLSGSSPDISLNQDAMPQHLQQGQQAQGQVQQLQLPLPIAPVAAAQIRLPTPEPRYRHEQAQVLLENNQNLLRNLPPLNFDPDVIEHEEENYMPAYVHMLPVVLPAQAPEPTLDEMLRRVTGRTDLHNVDSVRLRVISYTLSLSHLAMFLPCLQQLDLSGSVLCTLRDLGYGLIHLTHLNVSNCGLNSLDGTGGFPNLRVLVADDNMIQRPGSLSDLPLLQHFSVRHNRISELGILTFLGMCANLLEIDLRGNPVCHQPLYRQTLQRNIATLQVLDGVPVNNMAQGGPPLSSLESDDISSLSSASGSVPLASPTTFRPATAPLARTNCEPVIRSGVANIPRPNSVSLASRSSSLSSGSPVMGSVLTLARQKQRRKQHHHTNAWGSSDSSNYSSAASSRPSSSVSSAGSCDLSSPQATAKYIF
uniref:Leucine-rich repeat-containing protein 56 n=1 Tax=Stomoxys calcitrans TaxID=35570 RepID=A0A1I8PPT5_STOCA